MNGPGASNRSLYRMELRRSSASYPEGNFGGNQLLDGSIGLSPLHPVPTIDLHVRGASDFHQSFLWLHPDRAWIAIFRVPGRSLHQSRPTRSRKIRPGGGAPARVFVARARSHRRAEGGERRPLRHRRDLPPLRESGRHRRNGDANDGDWNGEDAAPAGSGTARPKLRRDTSPGPEPSDTLSRFRYASGVSQCGPYDSRTARTPRSVFQDGSGGLPMHVADPR